uniref:Uncharacterized protein n=1 Tax=uncultured Elusimicrobia bacterium TaxID=699876 RepID=A0A650EMC4_9BACT|nr:hypothetical protein Elusimicrob2101_1820 [uncultured Elusimicrobia bacterium]
MAAGLGFLAGGWLGIIFFVFITGRPLFPSGEEYAAPQTAVPVTSVEAEKKLMSRFVDGLPELERMLDTWFERYGHQTDGSVRFLSENASPALDSSALRAIGCKVDDPSAEYPACRGKVYSFYDLQCDYRSCSWTLCRHNETPYSCTYSMNGYRDKRGCWQNNCNVLFPEARAFCEYLHNEKGFVINE